MLKDGIGFSRVIVCCGRVDLRKGIPGLTAYVKLNYGLDTTEKGTLFLFCGNRSDRIKGLIFEGDGVTLLNKRLLAGNRFQWPRTPDEARELTSDGEPHEKWTAVYLSVDTRRMEAGQKKRAQFLGVFHPQTPGFRAFWGHVSRAPKARGLSENHASIVRQKIE